ncbi:MAG TPA: hypothetical protein VLT60_04395, partial [Usitatibacter sp.]|nr:hypothetical protein [Usitatibacter sp.]
MKFTNRLTALVVAAFIGIASAVALVAVPGTAHAQAAEPAKAPAPPAGAGQDASTQKEVIENPYGLEALWKQGDFISRGVLIILVIMSMGSWYIMFVKVW